MTKLNTFANFFRDRGIFIVMHIIILILSIVLIAMISIDTFKNIQFYREPEFQKWQLWICVVFMADFFIELVFSKKKWKYIWSHLIFFFVSIPYQAILYHYDIHISRVLDYIVRFVPLIRGGYALAIVVSWFTSNKATGLFFSYIITLFSTVYFASLTFYLFEAHINPLVNSYTDALWWAAMDVTTVGSNIVAVTPVGRVLSVLLAALGMMMFPIFTVYVTNLMTKRRQAPPDENNDSVRIVEAYRHYVARHQKNKEKSDQTPPANTRGDTQSVPDAGSADTSTDASTDTRADGATT